MTGGEGGIDEPGDDIAGFGLKGGTDDLTGAVYLPKGGTDTDADQAIETRSPAGLSQNNHEEGGGVTDGVRVARLSWSWNYLN